LLDSLLQEKINSDIIICNLKERNQPT